MKVLHVVGARPNFPKIAPIIEAFSVFAPSVAQVLVHTGQHYDYNMSQVFFEQLAMPKPDEYLDVGSGSHAAQTAAVMTAFEPVLLKHKPDWVLVPGDVNSTLACALVCSKLGVPVAHVEAGLRSYDRSMPEEVNRVLTDQISDLLLTPSADADENLVREGIDAKRIQCVGNVMIDTLERLLPYTARRDTLACFGLSEGDYALVTLHRPSNVDCERTLGEILDALIEFSEDIPVIFPVHPRTRSRIDTFAIDYDTKRLRLVDPMGYLDFLALLNSARFVLTDSGGIQEETTHLGIPCLTARPNTERPITVKQGTNRLVRSRRADLVEGVRDILRRGRSPRQRIELWDGNAARRIVDVIVG